MKKSCKKYYKRLANRAVRRYKSKIKKGNRYRKVYDYKWTID